MTPAERSIMQHLWENVFLYHLSDDKNRFSMAAVRRMVKAGLLYRNRAGVDHDESCYELTTAGNAAARSELGK